MLFDCSRVTTRERGIAAAVEAVKRGDLIVMPTETVYGLGADAFKSWAVSAIRNAKGQGTGAAPAVLVGSKSTLDGLVFSIPAAARDLVEAFWPGPLTILVEHAPSLQWDLGVSDGTVSVRMPLHPVALEVLREAGPMAVTGANKAGQAPALTATEAQDQFGYAVSVYLDGGPCRSTLTSTIVDCTAEVPRLLRAGGLSLDRLRTVVPTLLDEDG